MIRRPVEVLAFAMLIAAVGDACAVELAEEQRQIDAWHRERVERLIAPAGWITLVGLYWLHQGDNKFGRASSNELALDRDTVPALLGVFTLRKGKVTFTANSGSLVTHADAPVQSIAMISDANGEPTVLNNGALQFFVIERAGRLGVRVRDTEHPARKKFRGIDRFPVSTAWMLDAKFEPYNPVRHIDIVNIVGLTESMVSPGAIVFSKDGKEHRLETVLELPDDKELFIMFADATTARETYGAGRYIYVPMPSNGRATIDFNKAYNPPCAFSDFATCPLPPKQNRLSLRVEAGEKKYEHRGN